MTMNIRSPNRTEFLDPRIWFGLVYLGFYCVSDRFGHVR